MRRIDAERVLDRLSYALEDWRSSRSEQASAYLEEAGEALAQRGWPTAGRFVLPANLGGLEVDGSGGADEQWCEAGVVESADQLLDRIEAAATHYFRAEFEAAARGLHAGKSTAKALRKRGVERALRRWSRACAARARAQRWQRALGELWAASDAGVVTMRRPAGTEWEQARAQPMRGTDGEVWLVRCADAVEVLTRTALHRAGWERVVEPGYEACDTDVDTRPLGR